MMTPAESHDVGIVLGVEPIASAREDDRRRNALTKTLIAASAAAVCATALTACSRDVQAMTPQSIERQYGVAGAYTDTVSTADGSLRGTLVPVTLADGRTAQLFIPAKASKEPHAVYLRDNEGLHPVSVRTSSTREEITRSPRIVERRAEPAHSQKRSWEKEALIIGGSAGAGTAIGALAGGKKGAGVGAAAGGVGGLIFDLLTRDKK
jgi:hypothetical protein